MKSISLWTSAVLALGVFALQSNDAEASSLICRRNLLKKLNQEYLRLHRSKESKYWAQTMGLASKVDGAYNEAEHQLILWRSDPVYVPQIDAALGTRVPEWIRTLMDRFGGFILGMDRRSTNGVNEGLGQWRRYFEINAYPDKALSEINRRILALEEKLAEDKGALELSYSDSAGVTHSATISKLRTLVGAEPDAESRRTAWKALEKFEKVVLASTYIDVIKARREFGTAAKFPSFYDYRTNSTEQMTSDAIFDVLDDLELNTREAARQYVEQVKATHGADALQPWNFSFVTSGDLETKMDPYFPFAESVKRWGQTFSALGVNFRNAELSIDLIDRQTKTQNGFIRALSPAYFNPLTGQHVPASAVFTSNGVLGKVGAGLSAHKTIFHEAGHGSHFANIETPSPAGSQEEAPTSIAAAETHSMFMDQLLTHPIWLKRYAKNGAGEPMPEALIEEIALKKQEALAYNLRTMLVVPYFERELYRIPADQLTPEKILEIARATERKLLLKEGNGFPVLCVFHTHTQEAAAYYHGYVLANLAVAQTQAYLDKRFGTYVDNADVGPLLTEAYWKPGNSVGFSDMVKRLTGEPFSARAMIDRINRTPAEVKASVRAAMVRESVTPKYTGAISLNASVRIADGDTVIAESVPNGDSFEVMSQRFADEIRRREAVSKTGD